jgi:hypothetical protein
LRRHPEREGHFVYVAALDGRAQSDHSTHTAALRYQHATNERHREVADRLGALLSAGASATEPTADVVEIGSR